MGEDNVEPVPHAVPEEDVLHGGGGSLVGLHEADLGHRAHRGAPGGVEDGLARRGQVLHFQSSSS